jgi:hypothetical protein
VTRTGVETEELGSRVEEVYELRDEEEVNDY